MAHMRQQNNLGTADPGSGSHFRASSDVLPAVDAVHSRTQRSLRPLSSTEI